MHESSIIYIILPCEIIAYKVFNYHLPYQTIPYFTLPLSYRNLLPHVIVADFTFYFSPKKDNGMDDSDHEEEFYYTEVEVTLDTVMQTFADMNTCSSPSAQTVPQSTQFRLPPDHDYQRKVRVLWPVEELWPLANRHIY